MTEDTSAVDKVKLAIAQTRSVEQQTLDVLVRIEGLVREALSLYAVKPPEPAKAKHVTRVKG